ncbi:hypothetical protein ACFWMQ_15895 [Streptomyces sp. NPDC058372]|uniref:hypothetical protein n=1 Tax=Streptomyces sp. NPDC058372 TaxID=3346464 RepID=UPI00364B0209
MRFSVTLRLGPVSLLQRAWYWRTRQPVPRAVTPLPTASEAVRLLPQRWAGIHKKHATRHRYYWAPCPLCGDHYGGHQAAGSVPDPLSGPGTSMSVIICPRCTRAGRSVNIPYGELPDHRP